MVRRALVSAALALTVVAVPALAKGGGGGSTSATGPLASLFFSSPTIAGGQSGTLLIGFSTPAPAGGWALALRSSSAALQVPASVAVPAGATGVSPVFTTSAVSATTVATVTVTLGGQSRSNTITVYPSNPTLTSPSLLAPSNGARPKFRQSVTFDWSDVAGASGYQIQIDASPLFVQPYAINIGTQASTWNSNGVSFGDPSLALNTDTGLRYWHVRAMSITGAAGPWSVVRSFTIQR